MSIFSSSQTDFCHGYAEVGEQVRIHYVIGGRGEPLLLLHGHPETWRMWHKIMGTLAQEYTVIAADLKGYGDSSKPEGRPDHSNYSKRAMGEDMIRMMSQLGYDHFYVMGHDRGARVGYRMALDHPEVVDRLILLDIVSTCHMYARTDREFAGALCQWFFFTQPAPLPEHMIENTQKEFFRFSLHISRYNSENDTAAEAFPEEVYRDYEVHYDRDTIHAVCEEYRAGECIDRVLDEADLAEGRKISCPTLVLWGRDGLVERFFEPLKLWSEFCIDVRGRSLPSGHFIPEEAPLAMLPPVMEFLRENSENQEV